MRDVLAPQVDEARVSVMRLAKQLLRSRAHGVGRATKRTQHAAQQHVRHHARQRRTNLADTVLDGEVERQRVLPMAASVRVDALNRYNSL